MTIVKSTIAGAVIVASLMSGVATQPAAAGANPQTMRVAMKVAKPSIGIALNSKAVSRATLHSMVQQKALAKGITLTPAELNQAVNAATNKLASAGNGPQKGIIHLKFRRFTICISWGADKGHC